MKYYVWLEYYDAAIAKNVKSDELKFYDGHQHGVQPSQNQVNGLQPSLTANVQAAYATYNRLHPDTPLVAPAAVVIQQGRTVETRSEK